MKNASILESASVSVAPVESDDVAADSELPHVFLCSGDDKMRGEQDCDVHSPDLPGSPGERIFAGQNRPKWVVWCTVSYRYSILELV